MKNFFFALIILMLILSISYCIKLSKNLEGMDYLVEELNEKIDELESELHDLKTQNLYMSEYDSGLNELHERELDLLKEQLNLEQNKIIKMEVFYNMIEDSEFEDYIESTSYINYENSKLNKVILRIEGTDKIIDLYSHLYSEYHWLYATSNLK